MINNRPKGYLLVMLAVLFWAPQGSVGKILMDQGIHPVTLAAGRILFGSLVFFIHIMVTNPKSIRIEKKDRLFFILFGIFGIALLHFSFNYAVFYTGVATASILLYTAPAFVTVLSIFFFQERPTLKRILALILTILGCVLITAANDLTFNRVGIIFGILAGFSYGLWSILSKKGLERYTSPVINFYNLFIGGLALLLASLFIAGPASYQMGLGGWLGMLAMAFFHIYIPGFLYVNSMKFMAASKASILANFEVVIAVLLGYFLFKESFGFFKISGFISIGIGLLLIVWEDYQQSLVKTD